MRGHVGMKDRHDASQVGRRLFQHFKPFAAHRAIETDEAGDIAARTCEAGDESGAERIADPGEHDRHLRGHWLEQFEREIAPHHENIGGNASCSATAVRICSGPPAHQRTLVLMLRPCTHRSSSSRCKKEAR